MIKRYCQLLAAATAMSIVSHAMALDPRADLDFMDIQVKEKCSKKAPCYVSGFTVYINNPGHTDSVKTSVDCYLSNDGILDTNPDSPTADVLLKRVTLGVVKTDNNRKVKFGGGQFKQLKPTLAYTYFFVVDPDSLVDERDETDNVFQYGP